MIELLYAIITVLGISFLFYLLIASFQNLRIYFYLFQLIVWIILICEGNFKNHILWDEPEYYPIYKTSSPPIKNIRIKNDSRGYLCNITFDYSTSYFSIVKTAEYSKECLENYFIPSDKECPITKIIVDYNNKTIRSDYEQIKVGDIIIYYKRNFKYGQLYKRSIKYSYNNTYMLCGKYHEIIPFDIMMTLEEIEKLKIAEWNQKMIKNRIILK